MEKKFKIGETVFRADYGREEYWVECPDCGGSTKIHVTLADGSVWAIACRGCDPGGYRPSLGIIRQTRFAVRATSHCIIGIDEGLDTLEYKLESSSGGWYCHTPDSVFATEAEAIAYGNLQKQKREAEENKRFMAKTKDTKSWAWNLAYHRREAKRAETDLAHHQAKAAICKEHVKDEK